MADLQVGGIYLVRFADHVRGMAHPCQTVYVGWLMQVEPGFLVFRSWDTPDETNPHVDNSDEDITIIRSTISEITMLG